MAIYKKHISVGSFLKKGEDIKDKDIVTIGSEGKEQEGQYGIQTIFLLKTQDGKEGNVGFNQTSINALIDAYGEDSKNWIGKQAKVWSILSNVQGKMTKVYYFTHPNADIDDEGVFFIPKQTFKEEVEQIQGQSVDLENKERINPEDIPFKQDLK